MNPVVHFEMPYRERERAARFYTAAFGWQVQMLGQEMGHYLLNTSSHARRGLMRARIDARDFADLRSGAFFLDTPAADWIRRALAGSAAAAHAPLARFVHAP